MPPVKTRSTSSKKHTDRGYKADPDDTNDDDDFYGMRELKHQLAGLNLQLKDTIGDGNCLFRACADQFHGSESHHATLRGEVCQYIEDHEEHFKFFLDDETVEAHVAKMRRNGTYGGNIELVAFARMKRVDIKVYQPGYIYVIEGVDVKREGSNPGERPVMHIAYHSWEHYSSIRNIDGPHEGPPQINPRKVEQKPLRKLTKRDPPRAIERTIMKVTGVDDLELVRELLEKYKGDVDSVYNEIYEKAYPETKEDAQGEEEEGALGSKKETENDGDPQSEAQGDPQPESQDDSTVVDSIPSTTTGDDTLSLDEPSKVVVPKKRISGREKKELAKRNQKLNRKNKGKGKEDADSNTSSNKGGERDPAMARKGAGKPSTMRELFV
ncbi:MAG: hypothetical protein J3Q66DRAFT_276274 [Benniella sp.]|nr:MAG: hypothetical protein J3Q66DRAFT_276274 [Benniella sp.]